jgi:D-alanine-D-alanine ligase
MAGGEGYGRVDMRLSESGQPYVIELNPCPDLSSNAGLARLARAFGGDYTDLVTRLVDEAMNRSQSTRAAAALATGTVPA